MRGLLSIPGVYSAFSNLIIRDAADWIYTYVQPQHGDKVLDIGCGPADILNNLPPVYYTGMDINRKYIAAARRNFGKRGSFLCQRVSGESITETEAFDIVMARGILHHLDDVEARQLFTLAAKVLKTGGRLVTMDGCYMKGQSSMARLLLMLDRGKYVRGKDDYLNMATSGFSRIEVDIREDMLRTPYTHIIMRCTK